MRVTRRDLTVAGVTAVATLALLSARAATPAMDSVALTWESFTETPTRTGSVRRVFQAPTATLDELESHITTLDPGLSSHEPHRHPDEEIIIIKEGTVESLVNGERRRLGPGGVIFQASNQLHAIRNVGDTPATYFVFKWNSPGMLKARGAAGRGEEPRR